MTTNKPRAAPQKSSNLRIARLFTAAALVVGCLLPWALAQAETGTTVVRHPRQESGSEQYMGYYWGLLREALARTTEEYGPARVIESNELMNQQRAMEELALGNIEVNAQAYIYPEFLDRLTMVPFPLDRGLLGNRISLIHKDNQKLLESVKTVDNLKKLSLAQGATWVDAIILEAAGLKVQRSSSYPGIFKMIENKHAVLFPRGLNEVRGEYEGHKVSEPNLVIDKSLVLSYPLAFYFITPKTPAGMRLNARLLLGIQKMVADGSFKARFDKLKAFSLVGLDMGQRRIIKLPNRLYNQDFYKLDDPSLWETIP